MHKTLNQDNSLLLIIDVQEKLVNMLNKNTIENKTAILAKAASILDIPTIVTEQYPKGLGNTMPSISINFSEKCKIFEKTTFSVLGETEIKNSIKESGRKQIIICGIETHICVLQSAIELINEGYEVYIVKDACASRNKYEFKLAIERLQAAGAIITCVEMVIFELLKDSKNPNFKALQSLIK